MGLPLPYDFTVLTPDGDEGATHVSACVCERRPVQ
jgi:hypothetical protein